MASTALESVILATFPENISKVGVRMTPMTTNTVRGTLSKDSLAPTEHLEDVIRQIETLLSSTSHAWARINVPLLRDSEAQVQ